MKAFIATLMVALVMAPAALAADSSVSGYGGVGGNAQDSLDGSGTRAISDDSANSLPFTGYDALAIGGVGLVLAGLGLTLRLGQRRADTPV